MRRLLIVPLVALIAGLLPASSAAAETLCTVNLPATVTATAPSTAIWPTFTGCQGATASWDILGYPYDDSSVLGRVGVKDGVSQGAFRFLDSDPTGTLKTETASGANAPTLVVKFGSRITLTGHRETHLLVPLSGVVSRYVRSENAFRRWASRPVAISYKDCVECPWKFLVMDKTNKYGAFSLGAVSFEARYYRAKIGDTSSTWGRTSTSVYF